MTKKSSLQKPFPWQHEDLIRYIIDPLRGRAATDSRNCGFLLPIYST
jgi:hypothetical protein